MRVRQGKRTLSACNKLARVQVWADQYGANLLLRNHCDEVGMYQSTRREVAELVSFLRRAADFIESRYGGGAR